MRVTKKNLSDTKVALTLTADEELLTTEKDRALRAFAGQVKIQGFRPGKVPLAMLEKHINPAQLQSEFLDRAVNRLYLAALEHEKLRPVDRPEIKINKFVPFDTLEIEAEVEVVGAITLPDYKKIKLAKPQVKVEAKEVDSVIDGLRTQSADKKDVDRASANGDEVWIDFTGVDAKTKDPIKGADGKDFPLLLGSDTFIPGFEANLVGLKAEEEKTFTLTFPKDYGLKALQNRKVEFSVTIKKVQEVIKPELDDAFAAKIGPFKDVVNLKQDIEKELLARKQSEAESKYADDLILKIVEKSKVAMPEALITEQIERLEHDQRQNLLYRGQTWQEFLDSEKLTEDAYRKKLRPDAELRVKAGLILAEIADAEKVEVTAAELDAQLQALKGQYTDPGMQAELAKPEARRSIASRLLTEKTMSLLVGFAQA